MSFEKSEVKLFETTEKQILFLLRSAVGEIISLSKKKREENIWKRSFACPGNFSSPTEAAKEFVACMDDQRRTMGYWLLHQVCMSQLTLVDLQVRSIRPLCHRFFLLP